MSVISKKLESELNTQINRELEAAYIYYAIANYCDSRSLDGISQWMHIQAEEEIGHAKRINKFLLDLGATVELLEIPKPRGKFSSLEEAFQVALNNEEDLARRFNELAGLALEEKDNISYNFLKWFLDEQVEEIALVGSVLEKVRLVGENGNGIMLLNEELAKRGPDGETK